MSAHVISFINLKGGVGKTTTTIGLAHVLSAKFGKKVLVIDLDPQTNATVMLIGEEKWRSLNQKGFTLATMFSDALQGAVSFNLQKTLQREVSGVAETRTVDLLPSSIELINLQDHIVNVPPGKFNAVTPTTILYRAIREIIDDYDYILIDCPPNLGFITLNGLYISDGYIIPTIPDVLSTYGIPQIIRHIGDFSAATGRTIRPLGIVATRYRKQAAALHDRVLNDLRRQWETPGRSSQVPLFKAVFPKPCA